MNIKHTIKTLGVVLALGAGSLAFAGDDKEEIVLFAAVPAAAQKTILAQIGANSAILGEVEKDVEKGKTIYTAKITAANGQKLEVEVAADGTLIKVEGDDDDEKDGDKDDKDDKK